MSGDKTIVILRLHLNTLYIHIPPSDIQLKLLTLLNRLGNFFVTQGRFYPILQKLINLFWRTTNKTLRIQKFPELTFYRIEIGFRFNTFDQIVFEPELLDLMSCFV